MSEEFLGLQRTTNIIRDGISRGLHIGAQLYVSHQGKTIADLAFGNSRPGVSMRTDTLMLWLSAGKPVTAVAIAQQWERGKLDLDDLVAQYIPEFAANGKNSITIRHLLTHTAGIRAVVVDWAAAPWETIIAAVCNARIESGWTPGKKAGYHIHSSWFILAEIVRRLDGREFERYVREEISLPIGMNDSWIGMPVEQYRAYEDRIGWMQKTNASAPSAASDPRDPRQAQALMPGLSTAPAARTAYPSDTEPGATLCRPSSNARGPVRELGLFYEMLLNRGRSGRAAILRPQTVEAMTSRHRAGMMDHTFKHVVDWGLGFIVNSSTYLPDTAPYGFGPHASPRTFGHGGSQTSVGFCDPENELVVALLFNGAPGEDAHDQRLRATCAAIYQDVGIASSF